VSDGYGNAAIHRFTESGEHVASWGRPGGGPGEFMTPHGIFVAPDGTVGVADRENDRVQWFTADGTFLREWAGLRRPSMIFRTPDGLWFVAEMGYVSGVVHGMPLPTRQSLSSRVTVRDGDGRLLASIGADDSPDKRPCDPGNFFAAHGLWVDRDNRLYVGEVIAAAGPKDVNEGLGWVPVTCHAFQVLERQHAEA
jgi:hypothetical protein